MRRNYSTAPGRPSLTIALVILTGILLWSVTGCQEPIEDRAGIYLGDREPAIIHPLVERDLAEISGTGVLRMITFYNSRNYFIHKGGQVGFDFELLDIFARARGLTIEVVIPNPGDDVVSLLNSGEGDVICAGLVPGPHLERWVTATRPTNFVSKVVVLHEGHLAGGSLSGLAGLRLTLPDGDPFREDLLSLRDQSGIRFFISSGRPGLEAEELIAMVSQGELEAVVVNDIAARAALAYLTDIKLGPVLSERQPTAWFTRENSPDLKAALNTYLKRHFFVTQGGRPRRSATYGRIFDRYFENEKTILGYREQQHRPDKSGRISNEFDQLIKDQAGKLDLDWRMVAALIYEESRFYPKARSKADARGLMQVLPRYAGAQADSLYEPEANLRAGLRMFKSTFKGFAYLDSLDRWRFTLAVYHAGAGHVADARLLAMEMGRDPNIWERSLAVTLPKLTDPAVYPQTRYGYYNGVITVDYVEQIINKYRQYIRLVPRYEEPVSDKDLDSEWFDRDRFQIQNLKTPLQPGPRPR